MTFSEANANEISGLEADQKVIAVHGCYAMTATTALTAQNTLGVDDIHETPSEFVRKQIDASVNDIGVDVVKTCIGIFSNRFLVAFVKLKIVILASEGTISVVADAIRKHNISKSVIDPVRRAWS